MKPLAAAGEYEDALRRAVLTALADYPVDAASVTEERSTVWGMEVQPNNRSAASAYVTFTGGDEVVVGFGQTHAYIWDDEPAGLGDYTGAILAAVFAGDFEEAGVGEAFARVRLRDGTTVRVGKMHLPLPWRLRRRRRYAPLAARDG